MKVRNDEGGTVSKSRLLLTLRPAGSSFNSDREAPVKAPDPTCLSPRGLPSKDSITHDTSVKDFHIYSFICVLQVQRMVLNEELQRA